MRIYAREILQEKIVDTDVVEILQERTERAAENSIRNATEKLSHAIRIQESCRNGS